MKNLDTIKKIPMDIAVTLASNSKLQQLLVDDSNKLSDNFKPYSINQLLEIGFISFTPVIDNNIQDNTRNSFLIINLDEINFADRDDNLSVNGAIFIGTDRQHALLDGNTLRLLEIIDEVLKTLNHKKLSASGEIQLNYATFVSYSEQVFGYKIMFNINEQTTRKAEI